IHLFPRRISLTGTHNGPACDQGSEQPTFQKPRQTIAMVDRKTGEFTEKTLSHEGNEVREFYAALEGPVVVGIEATGAMQWFLELLEELGILCRVGHPAKIRAVETRQQKHDRRDARLMLDLLIWVSACGSCCATRLTTKSSAAADSSGSAGKPMRECQITTVVL